MLSPRTWLAAVPLLAVALLLAITAPAQAPPTAIEVDEQLDLPYAEGAGIRHHLDLYAPASAEHAPVVMFVHGGTWIGGSKEQHAFLGRAFAQQGFVCAVINYRFYPIARGARLADDVGSAFAWLHAHAAEHGGDPHRMFVVGHSAGAHLGALFAFDRARQQALGLPADAVRGFVGLSGIYDVRPQHDLLRKIFGRTPGDRTAASPIAFANAQSPPSLVLWSEHELLNLDLSARMLLRKLQLLGSDVHGHVLPGENHVSYLFRIGGQGDTVGPEVFAFVRARCAELDRSDAATPPAIAAAPAVEARRDLRGDGERAARLDLWRPQADRHAPLLLLVPDAAAADAMPRIAALWAARGLAVATLTLPIDAARPFDDAVRDVAAATVWLRAHDKDLGIDAARVAIGGVGTGGTQALLAAFDPRHMQAVGAAPGAIAAVVAIAAPTDLRAALPTPFPFALATDEAARDRASPLRYVVHDGPPVLLIGGERDATAADNRAFVQRLGLTAHDHIPFEIPAHDRAQLLAHTGTADDELSALVLGFLVP